MAVFTKAGTVAKFTNIFNASGRVETTPDPRNNCTTIKVQLLHGTNKTYQTWEGAVMERWIRLDGTYNYYSNKTQVNNPWGANPCILVEDTFVVYHDSSGKRSVDLWLHAYAPSGGWGPDHCYVETSGKAWKLQLPNIDRTGPGCDFNITNISTTGATIKSWSTAGVDCDLMQYSLNGGAWTNGPNFVRALTGLTPNTTYTVKVRLRKTYNWVWSSSSTKSFTTHPNPVSISTLVATAVDPFTVTVSATSNSTSTTEKINVTCNGTTKTITGGTGTVSFTVNPDTTYSISATAYTVRSGATSTKTTSATTPADSFCRVIEPNGTISGKKKMYLIDTTGVVTEVKKPKTTVL